MNSIWRLENLGIVVAGMISMGFVAGIGITHWVASGDRDIIHFNRKIIQECKQDYAKDEDNNGWYTCPIFQLPMPRK